MKDISGLEVWLFQWIVAPFIGAILIFDFYMNSQSIDRCENICHDQGYADFKHKSGGKFGSASCFCLTEEQVADKSKFSKIGKQVF